MRKVYKVVLTKTYTQSYEILADDESEALEKADDKFSNIELRGEDLEYIGEDKVELIEQDEDNENPNAYEEWDEWNRYYKDEEN